MATFRETGDMNILALLYKPYMPLVYGVCLKYLKNREMAQDAVMSIFEELVTKVPRYQIDNFKSWLHVLSKHYCLMLLRKKSREQPHQTEEIVWDLMENGSWQHHEEEAFVIEDQLDKLELCMQKLKNEQKTCVELFYIQKKSYQEITVLTSFELNKVKSFIQNGKRNLKQCIEQCE